MIAAVIIPDDAELFEVAREAKASHLHLIHNGRRVVLSPIVPPGWHEVAVSIKHRRRRPVDEITRGELCAYEETVANA